MQELRLPGNSRSLALILFGSRQARKRMTSSSTPSTHQDTHLSSSLRENRVFPPPPEFAAKAYVRSLAEYEELYARSIADPEAFWDEVARELHWFAPWTKTLDWNLPWAKWFVGGKT